MLSCAGGNCEEEWRREGSGKPRIFNYSSIDSENNSHN